VEVVLGQKTEMEYLVNRSELLNAVAEKTATPRTQVEAALAATLDQIMAATATGDKVILAGFGHSRHAIELPERAATPRRANPCRSQRAEGWDSKPEMTARVDRLAPGRSCNAADRDFTWRAWTLMHAQT